MKSYRNISIYIEASEQVWEEASKLLINWLKNCYNQQIKTLLLLSGGSSVRLYGRLAKFICKSNFNFNNLAIAQVDERFQPDRKFKDNDIYENINAADIEWTGLWHSCRLKGIEYKTVTQQGTLSEAAEKYNQTISKLFKAYQNRVAILGIGVDCHTAGLLPGYRKDWDVNKFVVGYENKGEFKKRISITPYCIRKLDQAFIVIEGESKREALKNALKKENINNLNKFPATLIKEIRMVDLFSNL